jgi:hypothetical protein
VKKAIQKMARVGLYALLLSFLSLSASAQKLAGIQEGSVWAPANVKIDAKLYAWNNIFQAYNKTIDVFYTVANDASNLYLVMKSVNQSINNKILGGGINFTINTDSKKKEKDAFTVIFPLVDLASLRKQIMQFARGMGGQPQELDSAAIASLRKRAVSLSKEIKLVGFKDVPDSVISIYNEYGVKAFTDFDNKGALIVEIAIPLKYLHLSASDASSFAYNIKLNGIQVNALFPGASSGFGSGGVSVNTSFSGGGSSKMAAAGLSDLENMISPTDFWGKYTLAKK